MASFLADSPLKRSASCSVCLDQYDGNDHVPKFLPCQHTFCASCLTNLPRNGSKISCPQCRVQHQVPFGGGFPTNRAVLDIVEEIQKLDKTDTAMKCKDHESANCILVCMDCLEGLCPKCLKGKSHASHQFEEPDEAQAKLSARLETVLKEKQSELESARSKFPGCPSHEQIKKVKSDVKDVCSKLRKCLSDWEKRQESLIASWQTDAEERAALLQSGKETLRTVSLGSDMATTLRNLDRVISLQVPVGSPQYDYDMSCRDLAGQIHHVYPLCGSVEGNLHSDLPASTDIVNSRHGSHEIGTERIKSPTFVVFGSQRGPRTPEQFLIPADHYDELYSDWFEYTSD